jgi:hypothetical protein
MNSDISNSSLHSSSLDVHIVKHHLDGTGVMYDEHVFEVQVSCEQISFKVYRTYIDFIELHSQLRKKFPLCDIFNLPLEATQKIKKMVSYDVSRQAISRQSSISPSSKSPIMLKRASSDTSWSSSSDVMSSIIENIEQKLKELNVYIRSLLSFHEIGTFNGPCIFTY